MDQNIILNQILALAHKYMISANLIETKICIE